MPGAPNQQATSRANRVARTLSIDSELPEAVRRPMCWHALTPVLALLALAVLIVLDATGVVGPPHAAAIFGIGGATIALCVLWRHLAVRALRRAAAADHLLCPECLYDLRTLDATGTCPECGRAYEHDAVRQQRIDAERRLKRK
ncbi:MAG: hypothetical protein AAFV77_03410 [Planctomycetota bacterium]